MAATTTHERPANVPADARWVDDAREWELGPRNGAGLRHGPYRFWRPDGALAHECHFDDGKPHGPFKRFHASGEVASEGNMLAGELHGTHVWYAGDRVSTEAASGADVSVDVRRSETDYDLGKVVMVRHFNAKGERVLAGGQPMPPRPEAVPQAGDFCLADERWQSGRSSSDGHRLGLWRFWTARGVLIEEAEFEGGQRQGWTRRYFATGALASEGCFDGDKKHGVWRTWTADGSLASEASYADDAFDGLVRSFGAAGETLEEQSYCQGLPDGPCRRPVTPGQLRDPQILTQYGCMLAGRPVGLWLLLGAGERVVGQVDYGIPRPADAAVRGSAPFSEVGRPASTWKIVAAHLLAQRRIGEALCAAARGAAEGASGGDLALLLERHTVRRASGQAAALAAEVVEQAEGNVFLLADGLVDGADPASLFGAMAFHLLQESRRAAAVDFINAALLLAPARCDLRYTRSLAYIAVGEDRRAAEDAAALAPLQPVDAAYLKAYIQALFPVFDFWPARAALDAGPAERPLAPVRDVADVSAVIQKYATRLAHLRARIRGLVPGQPRAWMPPDLVELLPAGPVELRAWELPSSGPGGAAPGVDERLVCDEDLATLQRAARAEWQALTWLCWSVGLSAVALPGEVSPPPAFGVAAAVAAQRFWRCHDQHATGGTAALEHGMASFDWDGTPIAQVPASLLFLPTTEYAEMQAMFLWLTDARIHSPWQSELRDLAAGQALTTSVPVAPREEMPWAVVHFEVFVQEEVAFALDADGARLVTCERFSRDQAPERFVPAAFSLPPVTPRHAFRQPLASSAGVVSEGIKAATACYAVRCETQAPADFAYLQAANAAVAAILAHGRGVVVDRTSGIGYLAEQFLRVKGDMAIRDTVALATLGTGPTVRLETRGMGKFANQDFAMNAVPADADTLEVARRWLYDNVCSLAAYREAIVSGETMAYSHDPAAATLIFRSDEQGYLVISDCHPERAASAESLATFFATTLPMFVEAERALSPQAA